MPPAVEKLWTTCASHFASLNKSDEGFLREKGLEILASWGVDPAAMQRRAVRRHRLYVPGLRIRGPAGCVRRLGAGGSLLLRSMVHARCSCTMISVFAKC